VQQGAEEDTKGVRLRRAAGVYPNLFREGHSVTCQKGPSPSLFAPCPHEVYPYCSEKQTLAYKYGTDPAGHRPIACSSLEPTCDLCCGAVVIWAWASID